MSRSERKRNDIWQRKRDEGFLAAKRSRAAASGGGGINRPKGKLFGRGVAGRYVRARTRVCARIYTHMCMWFYLTVLGDVAG